MAVEKSRFMLKFVELINKNSVMKIAVIGTGNMGSAIAASLVGENVELVCTARAETTLDRLRNEFPKAHVTSDNRLATAGADVVIVAVEPCDAQGVFGQIGESLKPGCSVVSVMAGITLDGLKSGLRAEDRGVDVFRVIPNTAIRSGESVTFIAHVEDCPEEKVREVERIFSLSGTVFIVPEKDMGACTALASCGIAYFLRFIRAAVEGGVELGLPVAFATKVAALTARGAAALLKGGAHPESEIDKVTTPGGITIRGLNTLEDHGFTAAVIAALRASCPSDRH